MQLRLKIHSQRNAIIQLTQCLNVSPVFPQMPQDDGKEEDESAQQNREKIHVDALVTKPQMWLILS